MKKIDFKQYNEKLKINPVSQNEFDKINIPSTVFDKTKLSNYDIMLTAAGNYYMLMFVGLTKDFSFNVYLDKMYRMLQDHSVDMFIRIKHEDNDIKATYLTLYGYDDLGNRFTGKDFTIHFIWKAPSNIKFDKDDIFDRQGFKKVISKYNYKMIFQNENI